MATELTETDIVNIDAENCSLREEDKDLTLLTLLQEANKCSDYLKQLNLLARCVSCAASCERPNIEYLLLQEQFQTALMNALDSIIIPAFSDKEHFSYDKDDFQKYPEITSCVLWIIHNILQRCEHSKNIDDLTNKDDDFKVEQSRITRSITFIFPKLILIIGAHRNCPMWSTTQLEDLSLQVLDRLLLCFSCESPNELFSIDTYSYDAPTGKVTGHKVTLFNAALLYCLKPLSKDLWHQNPFLCQAFHWLILQMKLPNLSDYIEQVMSVSLNFLEDYQPVNKIRGIFCLHHLIKNTSAEEMRWLNRADVIYEKLKNLMYLKEAAVLDCLFPCLFDILKVLESPPDLDHHQYVLDVLLRDTEGENLLVLRKIYVRSLTILLEQMGIYSVRHLQNLIKITSNYLEVDDGFGETSARPDTLKLLKSIIKVAWPRIQQHADAILKLCLNFIADINYAMFQDSNVSDVQSDLTGETIECLVLLSEVCSDVLPCLKAALRSGMDNVEQDSHVFDVLQKQLAKIDA